MSLSQTINYDTPGNFAFDSAKIQVTSVAALKLIADPGKTYSQSFASDAGFTYDDDLAEFTGGLLRQKAQRPAGATFGARFDAFVDANWGDGDLTATVNSVAISGGKLDLSGAQNKGISFDADNLPADPMVGCVQFRFTPNYNGAPDAGQIFLNIKSNGGGQNQIELFHSTNGSFFILMNDENGTNILSNSVGNYTAISGQEIEVELSWDLTTAKKVKFFGFGFLVADLDADFVRSTDVDVIDVGNEGGQDFYYRDLVVYDAVQHTSNYTPFEYTLPAGDFVESSATLPTLAYPGPGSLQAYTAFLATITGTPRFILNSRYWNGSAWVASDGTYAQATAYAAAVANIATVPATNSLAARVVFGDGGTRDSIDLLTVTYTGQIYPTDDPAIIHGSGIAADDLLGFAATLAAGGSDGVHFQIQCDGINKWWNGAAWATSDGTYTQANTAAEIETNKDALDISSGAIVKARALLHSGDGSTSPTITSVTVTYDFFAAIPDPPAECTVYGFVRDLLGELEATAPTLIVKLSQKFLYAGDWVILPDTFEVDADDEGRFEISLVETATPEATYRFSIRFVDQAGVTKTIKLGDAEVPNSPSVNLASLTFT